MSTIWLVVCDCGYGAHADTQHNAAVMAESHMRGGSCGTQVVYVGSADKRLQLTVTTTEL